MNGEESAVIFRASNDHVFTHVNITGCLKYV